MMNTTHAPMTRRIRRELSLLAVLAALVFAPGALRALAQAPPANAPQGQREMPDLVAMLKATPGCLGVDAAQTASGKQAIFAWFENKKAVLNWYYSDGHQKLVRTFAPGGAGGRTPLAAIADDSGPILVIASLTMAPSAQVP